MLRVRDIMTRRVITLRTDATASSAAWSLHAANVSGAPVRDRKGNLVGVISTKDLANLARNHKQLETAAVEDAMTPDVWAVHPDDPALAAAQVMVEHGIHRVVVVSKPGSIEGIVTPHDILAQLLKGADFTAPTENARSPDEWKTA